MRSKIYRKLYHGIYNLTNKWGYIRILLNFILRRMANVDTNTFCARKGQILIFLPKSSLKLISSTCWSFCYWQHVCYLWWTCFSTDSRHTYGYKLCSSSRRLVPLFVRGRIHTGASQEKRKEAIARSFNFTVRYTDDVMSLNNARFGDFVDHIYLTELEIKDTTDTDWSATYIDPHLETENETLRQKRLVYGA